MEKNMRIRNKKGSVLITLIVAMVLMAVLGVGIYSLTSTSTFSELLSNRNDNAYQLAKSGIRYAIDTNGAELGDFLLPDNSKKFNLAKSGDVITSTGIVNEGTFLEARRVLKYTLAGLEIPVIDDFPDQAKPVGTPGAIANDGTTVTLGGSGANAVPQSYAAVWYNGDKNNGNCSDGNCSFGAGFRIYFEFKVPSSSGEGFTFAIMSALNNTNDRSGGFSNTDYPGNRYERPDAPVNEKCTSVAGGELLGYAGPGNTRTMAIGPGEGLRPPKMAMQFDTYKQDAYQKLYLAGSRRDPNTDYVGLMFWGDTTLTGSTEALTYSGGGTHTYSLSSFDDNRWPDAVKPGQDGRKNGLGKVNYAVDDNVLRSCRMEIARSASPETSGTYAGKYKYTINVWIATTSSLSALQKSRLQDVVVPLTDATLASSLRISNASAYFTSAEHGDFEKIFWGFTYGSGDAASKIPITNIIAFFPNTATPCSYAISPSSASYSKSGGSGSIALTTTSDCYWTASSLAEWITITSTAYGKGSGKINYTVSANTGGVRNGTIIVGGQTFSIDQEGCEYSISPTSRTVGRSAGTGTISITMSGNCLRTAVSSASWLNISSGASGSGSGTINYSYSQYTGWTSRTANITVTGPGGEQVFTLKQTR